MTKALNWIIALLGLWEAGDIAALFVPGFGQVPAYLWNHIGVGVILMLAGAWAALTTSVATARTMNWIAALAGAWLVIATFVLRDLSNVVALLNDVVVGVIVVVLASASWLLLRRRA